MFKRYLPGTKNSAFKTPTIRPIEIGFMKRATFNKKISGPLFRKKQPTNSRTGTSWNIYNKNIAEKNKMPRKSELPEFEVMKATRTRGGYGEGWENLGTSKRAINDTSLDPNAIYAKQYSSTARPIEPERRGKIPSYAESPPPRLSKYGRPPGSKNKKGTKLQFEPESETYLSGHATGKYKKSHKSGKPMTIRIKSKFGVHYDYILDENGHKTYKMKSGERVGKPLMQKVSSDLNWSHLSPFHAYAGRPLPQGYDDGNTNNDITHPPFSRSILQDGERRAKLPGFRISGEGQREIREIKKGRSQWTVPQVLKEHGYYEYRRNRADAKPVGGGEKISVGKKKRKIGWI